MQQGLQQPETQATKAETAIQHDPLWLSSMAEFSSALVCSQVVSQVSLWLLEAPLPLFDSTSGKEEDGSAFQLFVGVDAVILIRVSLLIPGRMAIPGVRLVWAT